MSSRELAGLDDDELIDRYRSENDRYAMDQLWLRHAEPLRRSCRKVLRNDATAEDIVQDAFLRALRRLPDYTAGNFPGWLWRIAYRLCLDHLRSSAARHETAWTHEAEQRMMTSDDGFDHGEAESLLALIEGLPERQRVVLKLFYLEEFSYERIADVTGFGLKEVKSLIQNGRRMLRKKSKGEDGDVRS